MPDLKPGSRQAVADVVVELADDDHSGRPAVPEIAWIPESTPFPHWKAKTSAGTYVRLRYAGFSEEAEFVIGPQGKNVWAWWSGGVEIEDITALLIGPILACVLRHRGLTCLHASVVSVNGTSIACVGAKGAGKSTTALAMIQQGATLVADDVAALSRDTLGIAVLIGQARLRLRPAPAVALVGSFDNLRPIWSQNGQRPQKRYFDLPSRDVETRRAVPLSAVYVLGARGTDGLPPSLASEPPAAALPLLMAFRHMTFMIDRIGHARDFAVLSRVATSVPIKRVTRAEGVESVDDVAAMILRDAKRAAA